MGIAEALLMFGTAVVLIAGSWLIVFWPLKRKEKRSKGPDNVDGGRCIRRSICNAYRSRLCWDGRCRYHCSVECKCETRAAPTVKPPRVDARWN